MPQKLTIEYVKHFVGEATNGACSVLDDEYINDRHPIRILCKCGTEFARDFHHIKRGQLYCQKCKNDLFSQKYRKSMDDVISEIEKTGCEYVSGEYTNGNSVLTIRCRCGNIFQKKANKFFSGQDRCPECGRKNISISKTRYTVENVQREIAKSGYKIIDPNKYVNANTGVDCVCEKGHRFSLLFSLYLVGCSGCKECANAALRGSNHWNYQGGKSEVLDSLRKAIKPWKEAVKSAYSGKCAVTGEMQGRIDVHHLKPFLEIVDECCKETGIELKENLSDYSSYSQYETLKNAVIKKHTFETGLPICHSIHVKFHNQNKQDATPEQFDDFISKNYGVSLKDILKLPDNG